MRDENLEDLPPPDPGDRRVDGAPGASARAMQHRAGAGVPVWKRAARIAFDVHTDERAWRRGAEGEEEVARRLASLPAPWVVLHDLTVSDKGTNIDHIAVGPPGVYTLNTKHLSGRVTVYERALLHNGRKTHYLAHARHEAKRTVTALERALAFPVPVVPVIVLMGCEITVKQRPQDVVVVGRRHVRRWLTRQRHATLSATQLQTVVRQLGRAETWGLAPSSQPARPTAQRDGSAHAQQASPAAAPSPAGPVEVRRWRRYGKHRLYVNDGRTTLGWMDAVTGAVTVDVPERQDEVREALRAFVQRDSH